jgi:hypothetical protein
VSGIQVPPRSRHPLRPTENAVAHTVHAPAIGERLRIGARAKMQRCRWVQIQRMRGELGNVGAIVGQFANKIGFRMLAIHLKPHAHLRSPGDMRAFECQWRIPRGSLRAADGEGALRDVVGAVVEHSAFGPPIVPLVILATEACRHDVAHHEVSAVDAGCPWELGKELHGKESLQMIQQDLQHRRRHRVVVVGEL